MSKLLHNGTVVLAVVAATVWVVERASSQSPQRIPNGGDQEQIVNLQLRVSHLEQALAQMQQQMSALKSGKGNTPPAKQVTSQVTAPFEVVNESGKVLLNVREAAGGGAILYVLDSNETPIALLSAVGGSGMLSLMESGAAKTVPGQAAGAVTPGEAVAANEAALDATSGLQYSRSGQTALVNFDKGTSAMGFRLKQGGVGTSTNVSLDVANGVGGVHLFDGGKAVGTLAVNPGGGGAFLTVNEPGKIGRFTAGVSGGGDGFAKAVSMGGGLAAMGDDANGGVGLRIRSKDGGPASAGMTLQDDGTGMVYAGLPGSPRAKMGISSDKEGIVDVLNAESQPMGWMQSGAAGGVVGVANAAAQSVASIGAREDVQGGGLAVFADAGGTTVLTAGATTEPNRGDTCIVRGDKPGRCLSQSALPLSIAPK
ncbi:MAG TPA: hypothetical protein VN893_20870 [Bryobacteraceae bacterium]|nr:hypothetical protein [Bryobacteraceae bacterium]